MAASLFSDVLQKAKNANIDTKTRASRTWFRNQAKEFKNVNPKDIMKSGNDRFRNRVWPGHMYSFYYDPKGKKDLPYYDMFPLIFPFSTTGGTFTGLNLHYLPHSLRAKLMDNLYDLEVKSKWNNERKLQLSYSVLSAASKFKWFKPCVKKYLTSHVRSRFIRIKPEEWETALWLPLERFEKASKTKVWADSRKIIQGK